MLKVDDLKKQIQSALSDIYKPAIKQVILGTFPEKTKMGDEMAETLANTFDELTAEPMADLLSAAIDYYVKNITNTGTIITAGSPFTQTAQIVPSPTPVTAGKIPNTLGIS